VLVEVSGPGNVPQNASWWSINEKAVDLKKHLKPLLAVAETVRTSLAEFNNPSGLEIEFGVELGGEAGIPKILSGSTKANFKITLKWENKEKPKGDKEADNQSKAGGGGGAT
jgi:hypothetical protein